MRTAPELGRRAEERLDVRDNVFFSSPPRSPQQKSQRHRALQRLRRLTAKIDALCVWRDDIQSRIEHSKHLFERGSLYQDQLEDLQDAVRAWRLVAARVALDLDAEALGDERRVAA